MNENQISRRKGVILSTVAKILFIALIIIYLVNYESISFFLIIVLGIMILFDAEVEYKNYGRLK